MRHLSSLLAFTGMVVLLGACSGGSGPSGLGQSPGCGSTSEPAFCLVACNLGCTQTGCAVTEIAQNQPIILTFNQDVDPSPENVNLSRISLKTKTGEEPVGQFLTNGNTVTFLPEVRVVGGASFFGFRANETYILSLSAGADNLNALRSTSGDALGKSVVCELTVSRGVIDLDQQPPRATLVTPSATRQVKRDTLIVVEFSELIDIGPFQGATALDSPILTRIRKTRQGPGGQIECNPNAPPLRLDGFWRAVNDSARQVTVATFKPRTRIPGGICVEVEVTNRVKDLAGTPSQGQLFQFVTEASKQQERKIEETFDNDLQLDREASSGEWGSGRAVPGRLGWDGLHGVFDFQLGRKVGTDEWEFSTDNQLIPKDRTLTGQDITVTDGVFRFETFRVPRNVKVRFVGKNPARIYVRGTMSIDGELLLNGQSLPAHHGGGALGQAGGKPGPGGSPGGKGADKGDGLGHKAAFDGSPGGDVSLPAGHAYMSRRAGTGGRGAKQFPGSGKNSAITFAWNNVFSSMVAAGGGGGGYDQPGKPGVVVKAHGGSANMGPPAAGGNKFDAFPIPAGARIIEHFAIGGSGGGGGGSHPFLSASSAITWRSGGGGGGGGGVFAARVGGDLVMSDSALIDCRGGSTPNHGAGNGYTSPGGGGSGGTILLQWGGDSKRSLNLLGTLDVSGGKGGKTDGGFISMETQAGDGSPGYVRLEVPQANPPVGLIGTTKPPATSRNVAQLRATEVDPVVGSRSKWYSTKEIFPPDFVRYVIRARIDGQVVTFSDDPSVSSRMATGNEPINFLVQGANVDASGAVDPKSIGPWRRLVGPFGKGGELSLADDSKTGLRFLLLFNRATAKAIEVESVVIVFKS